MQIEDRPFYCLIEEFRLLVPDGFVQCVFCCILLELGAMFGYRTMPSRWFELLELKDTISEVADRSGSLTYALHAGSATGKCNDTKGGEKALPGSILRCAILENV